MPCRPLLPPPPHLPSPLLSREITLTRALCPSPPPFPWSPSIPADGAPDDVAIRSASSRANPSTTESSQGAMKSSLRLGLLRGQPRRRGPRRRHRPSPASPRPGRMSWSPTAPSSTSSMSESCWDSLCDEFELGHLAAVRRCERPVSPPPVFPVPLRPHHRPGVSPSTVWSPPSLPSLPPASPPLAAVPGHRCDSRRSWR